MSKAHLHVRNSEDTDLWWFRLEYNIFGNCEASQNREGLRVEAD